MYDYLVSHVFWRYNKMEYKHMLYGAVIAAAMGLSGCKDESSTVLKIDLKALKEAQAEGLKERCDNNSGANPSGYWIKEAFEDAEEGQHWSTVEQETRIAQGLSAECCTYNVTANFDTVPFMNVASDYAKCSVPLVDYTKLREVYAKGLKAHGRKNLQQRVKWIFEEASEGRPWGHIELSLKYAKDYAAEAGLKLEEVVDSDSLQQLYAQYKR